MFSIPKGSNPLPEYCDCRIYELENLQPPA